MKDLTESDYLVIPIRSFEEKSNSIIDILDLVQKKDTLTSKEIIHSLSGSFKERTVRENLRDMEDMGRLFTDKGKQGKKTYRLPVSEDQTPNLGI